MRKLFVVTLLLPPIQVFSWTTPVRIADSVGRCPKVAIDKRGWVHVAFYRIIEEPFKCHTYYCYYDDSSWSIPRDISPNATQANQVAVTVDALCRIHVTWTDFGAVTGSLYYTSHNGTTWVEPTCMNSILPNTRASGTSDLACDSLNHIHLVWSAYPDSGGDGEIFYSRFDGNTWSHPVNVSNDPQYSEFVDVIMDKEEHIHAVWMDYTGNYGVRYSKYDGSSWSPSVLLPDVSGGQSVEPRIAVNDRRNLPHVVWEERNPDTRHYEVWYTCYDGSNWFPPCTLSFPGEDAYAPVVAADSQNRTHVVWRQWGHLYHRVSENGTWDIGDSIPDAMGWADMTIDNSSNSLHLVWFNARGVWYSKHVLPAIEESNTISPEVPLGPLFPNPIYNKTEMSYELSIESNIIILVSNIAGEVISRTDLGNKPPGKHKLALTREELKRGGKACSGIYFVTLKAEGSTTTKKLLLVH